jgi:nitric oxide reductase subunit B
MMRRLWLAFAAVMAVSFLVLGWVGTWIYQDRPPTPERVETTGGTILIGSGEIAAGQNVWQIHKENNILFPRSLELESERCGV